MNCHPYQSFQDKINAQSDLEAYPNTNTWYSFSGRIGRLRYLSYIMFLIFVFYLITEVIGLICGEMEAESISSITFAAGIPLSIYLILYQRRRLHDLGRTGWLTVMTLVPVLGFVFYIYLAFAPGKEEVNQYGASPRPNKWFHWAGTFGLPLVLFARISVEITVLIFNNYIVRNLVDYVFNAKLIEFFLSFSITHLLRNIADFFDALYSIAFNFISDIDQVSLLSML